MEEYAFPVIGPLHPRDITLEHTLRILKPIWTTKTLDALARVVREAEESTERLRRRLSPFATAAASKTKDNSATAASGISRNPFATMGNPFVATTKDGVPVTAAERVRAQQKICAEFWKCREFEK